MAKRPAKRPAVLGMVPAVLLLLIALWEIYAAARAGDDVPRAEAWRDAARIVREHHQAGELVVFAPAWIDPVGRTHLGDLIPIDMAGRMDDARYGVVWELSIRGARAPESRGRRVVWQEQVAGIHIRKLLAEPAEVVTDLVAEFPRAKVDGRTVGRPKVTLAEVGFAPRRCVQVQPWPNHTVRITYKGVRLGSSLVGYAGLADVFTRRDIRDPGRLEVFVNGAPVADVPLRVDDGDGWVRFAATTAATESAEIELRATAMGESAQKRLICFAAEARK